MVTYYNGLHLRYGPYADSACNDCVAEHIIIKHHAQCTHSQEQR